MRQKSPYPYLFIDRDRHGNERVFVRRVTPTRRKVRIQATRGPPEFLQEALSVRAERFGPNGGGDRGPANVKPHTLRWLVSRYLASGDYAAMKDKKEKRKRAAIFESCLSEPIKKEGRVTRDTYGDIPVRLFGSQHVKTLRDRRLDPNDPTKNKPAAANARRKQLSILFNWALDDEECQKL